MFFVGIKIADVLRIIRFTYENFRANDDNFASTKAKCKFCTRETEIINGQRGVTSNFVKHLRLKHADRYVKMRAIVTT